MFGTGLSLILLGGLLPYLLPDHSKAKIYALFGGTGNALIFYFSFTLLFAGATKEWTLKAFEPFGLIPLRCDVLSLFFMMIFSMGGLLNQMYTVSYLKPYHHQNKPLDSHFFFLSLLMISMILLCVLQNIVAFLFVWELMSLSSFFLVIFENKQKSVLEAGLKYLIAMHIGFVFICLAFTILYLKTGSFDFYSFESFFYKASPKELMTVLLLFFTGFGFKAGFIPLHTWLPLAHPAAPTHVSALMSGLMIKTGLLGFMRILSLVSKVPLTLGYIVLGIGLLTAFFGIFYALAQKDIKKMLAFSSIENMGIIAIGLGTGLIGKATENPTMMMFGFGGALFHVLNHALFKTLLFFSAGAVYTRTHTLQMEDLGGLAKTMPVTAFLFMTASAAISALPPLNGFSGEWLIYLSLLKCGKSIGPSGMVIMVTGASILAATGALVLLSFTKAFSIIFLGHPRKTFHETPVEADWLMRIPMILLGLCCLLLGLFPQASAKLVSLPMSLFISSSYPGLFKGFDSMIESLSFMNLSFLGLLLLFLFIRHKLLSQNTVSLQKTWVCAYNGGDSRMQYSASSYSDNLLKLSGPLSQARFEIQKPSGLFPVQAELTERTVDSFEKVQNAAARGISKILNRFRWLQSGSTQFYILYGLIFLLVALIILMVGE